MDLHIHTDRSDGRYTPDEVLDRCAKAGLNYISITDHDLAPSWPHGRVERDGRVVEVIHGVEMTGCHGDEELHLLVYFPAGMPEEFARVCRERVIWRAERYARAQHQLNLEGVPPVTEEAMAGERALTRLHLARAIHAAGHCTTIQGAFDRFLFPASKLFPLVELPIVEIIDMAKACGGVTSWAHPSNEQARVHLASLADAGLDGVELYRPRRTKAQRKELRSMLAAHGLFATGGSDWHGWRRESLGSFSMSGDLAGGFVEALAS